MYLSFANYTPERRYEMTGLFLRIAIFMVLTGSLLLLVSLYLAVLFCLSGLMFAVLASGVDISDRILTRKGPRTSCHLHASTKVYVSQTYACVRTYSHNRARSRRSASRPSFSTAKTGSDDGESDQGDSSEPPSPAIPPAISQSQKIQSLKGLKSNKFLPPWRGPGDWRIGAFHVACRKLAVKGAKS